MATLSDLFDTCASRPDLGSDPRRQHFFIRGQQLLGGEDCPASPYVAEVRTTPRQSNLHLQHAVFLASNMPTLERSFLVRN